MKKLAYGMLFGMSLLLVGCEPPKAEKAAPPADKPAGEMKAETPVAPADAPAAEPEKK
jgi:hypothetical protein